VNERSWWERLFDRDNPAGPIIVVVLLLLAIGIVLTIGPLLDRIIEGEKPASYHTEPPTTALLLSPGGYRPKG
jgi:hypothetical protein